MKRNEKPQTSPRKAMKSSRPDPVSAVQVGPRNFHERIDRGTGVISRWIDDSKWATKTRANFDRSIDQLRALPKSAWSKPNPASKIGNHTYVIRFKDVTSAQLRIFGHFFDSHHAFVMTLEGYEKDDVYYPKKYEKMADGYRITCDKDFSSTTVPFETLCAICLQDDNADC